MTSEIQKELKDTLGNWWWRMNNLYYIIDEAANKVRFQCNLSQRMLINEMHYMNIILKARQLGFTTFIDLMFLDACIFNSNIRAGIIAHTLDDAKVIFRDKVKFPYDNLPDQIRQIVPITKSNVTELELGNNSSIRVGTSLRSGTLQYLHISEYGKICAKFPDKATEVRTGALNTVSKGQMIFVESTAEGREGHFYDICNMARTKLSEGTNISEMEFKFTFWPWWGDRRYRLSPTFTIPAPMAKYFDELEKKYGIILDQEQKCWYVKKAELQLDEMKREFPSTPDEAFEASLEGAYYGMEMAEAELDGRISDEHKFIPNRPVNTTWDIGRDTTSIWFWQEFMGKIYMAAYYEDSGEGLPFYAKKLIEYAQRLGFRYGKHYFPHDMKVNEWGTDKTRMERAIDLKIYPSLVPDVSIEDGIEAVRETLPYTYFNKAECAKGISALKSYRKEWNEKAETWRDKPLHNWASHGADSFRYVSLAYPKRQQRKSIKEGTKIIPPSKPIKGIDSLTLNQLYKLTDKDKNRVRMSRMI